MAIHQIYKPVLAAVQVSRSVIRSFKRKANKPFSCTKLQFCREERHVNSLKIEQQHIFVMENDLEKAYNIIPWKLIWAPLKRKGLPGAYVEVIQGMYASSTTGLKADKATTDGFRRQRSTSRILTRSFSFYNYLNVTSEEIGKLVL